MLRTGWGTQRQGDRPLPSNKGPQAPRQCPPGHSPGSTSTMSLSEPQCPALHSGWSRAAGSRPACLLGGWWRWTLGPQPESAPGRCSAAWLGGWGGIRQVRALESTRTRSDPRGSVPFVPCCPLPPPLTLEPHSKCSKSGERGGGVGGEGDGRPDTQRPSRESSRPAPERPRKGACVPVLAPYPLNSLKFLESSFHPTHSLILCGQRSGIPGRGEGGEGAPAWRWQGAGWHPRAARGRQGAPREGARAQRERSSRSGRRGEERRQDKGVGGFERERE